MCDWMVDIFYHSFIIVFFLYTIVLAQESFPLFKIYTITVHCFSMTVIDTSDDISAVTDILTRRIEEFPPHWMSLFKEEPPGSPQNLRQHSPHHSPSPRCHRPNALLSSEASLASDNSSPCSSTPCSPHYLASNHFRPRTLSLDAKLSTLRGRNYGGLHCSCQPPSSNLLHQQAPPLSCSSSTSSNSSSEGSNSPESDLAFSRPAGARRSMRSLRAKLDPRNWLQSHI